ncbi:MAG: hypothetical protein JEY79_08360 [Pseudodesulfovibrio sp.]|nr:hypothetical protein [Pseudodesulfovibrio sp.]
MKAALWSGFSLLGWGKEREERKGRKSQQRLRHGFQSLELPSRRGSFLAEPPQKRTKKTRLSNLAACRSSQESDQSGSAPTHEKSMFSLPVQCLFNKIISAHHAKPPPPLCQLLSLEWLNARENYKLKTMKINQISFFQPRHQKPPASINRSVGLETDQEGEQPDWIRFLRQ